MKPKRILSEKEVSLEIDLQKLFGRRVNDPALRSAIAQDAIDIILKRTAEGQGVDGNGQVVKLKSPYSEAYAESLAFKGFNKKKDKVNMELTGSMLASVDLIAEQAAKIRIGIDNEDAPKAFNHITGDTVPKRPWLGLTSDDLDSLKDKYNDEVVADNPITAADIFNRTNLAKVARIVSNRKNNFEVDDE